MLTYDYEFVRLEMLTPRGIDQLLEVHEHVQRILSASDVATVQNILVDVTGDSFLMLGSIDMLIELGKLEEVVTNPPRKFFKRIVKFPEIEHAS